MRPLPGIAHEIALGVRRVLAPNPGPMTHWGTNSYLLGMREVAVIDPGPLDTKHINALIQAALPGRVSHILVTHAHADHSAGARPLSEQTGAPIYAFGTASAGRRPIMETLAASGHLGGGEGTDYGFEPDATLGDGDIVETEDWAVEALHLPGHFAGHLGFRSGDLMFSGDHLMGWSTTIISPPDGHLGDFMDSSQRLIDLAPRTCLTGHGAPINDASGRLTWLMKHRKDREDQILATLKVGPRRISDMVRSLYRDVPVALHPAAARNVLAHLIDLAERGAVVAEPDLRADAVFRLI